MRNLLPFRPSAKLRQLAQVLLDDDVPYYLSRLDVMMHQGEGDLASKQAAFLKILGETESLEHSKDLKNIIAIIRDIASNALPPDDQMAPATDMVTILHSARRWCQFAKNRYNEHADKIDDEASRLASNLPLNMKTAEDIEFLDQALGHITATHLFAERFVKELRQYHAEMPEPTRKFADNVKVSKPKNDQGITL